MVELTLEIGFSKEQIMALHGHTRTQKKRIKAKRKARPGKRGSRKHG